MDLWKREDGLILFTTICLWFSTSTVHIMFPGTVGLFLSHHLLFSFVIFLSVSSTVSSSGFTMISNFKPRVCSVISSLRASGPFLHFEVNSCCFTLQTFLPIVWLCMYINKKRNILSIIISFWKVIMIISYFLFGTGMGKFVLSAERKSDSWADFNMKGW